MYPYRKNKAGNQNPRNEKTHRDMPILKWLFEIFERYPLEKSEWRLLERFVLERQMPFVWYIDHKESKIIPLDNQNQYNQFLLFYGEIKDEVNIPINNDRKMMKRLVFIHPTEQIYRKIRRVSDVSSFIETHQKNIKKEV